MAELWPGGPIELPHPVEIGGILLTIPHVATFDLLHLIATGSWWQLVPNRLDAEHGQALFERLDDDDDAFDFEHLWEPATALLGRVAGLATRQGGIGWYPAMRLASSALAEWPLFNAWCASVGLDVDAAPPWKAIGGVYAWLRASVSSENLAKMEQEIWAPPPAVVRASPQQLPRHVRDEEAALALAALREVMPGEERVSEWTPPPTKLPQA